MNTMSNPCGGFLLRLLYSTASALLLAVAAAQDGFLNIDCGLPANTTYRSETTLEYVSDSKYTSNGFEKRLDSVTPNDAPTIYRTLRYFPRYKRNCYSLSVIQGTNYLVRASFMYGNYDGANTAPSFDLYLGVDLWDTVKLDNATHMYWTEIFSIATTGTMSVCLVNTAMGVPFISGLELRPLSGADGYKEHFMNDNSSLVTFQRIDVGGAAQVRFPADPYDRLWTPSSSRYGTPVSIAVTLERGDETRLFLPLAVMQTAVASSNPILVTWSGEPSDSYHFVLGFAGLQPSTGRRTLIVKLDGNDFYKPFSFGYGGVYTVYSTLPLPGAGQHSFTVEANEGSDNGPILNAFEIYKIVQPRGAAATFPEDVLAIKAVQDYYQIKKNWNADPCLPLDAPWDGLTCSLDNQSSPRIEALDLSNAGLSGAISSHLSQLTALRKLNLSMNNINGSLPSFLADFQYLSDIDFSSNNLSGSIPSALKEKEATGLTLRIDNNPQICQQDPCNQGKASDNKRNLIVIISVASSSVVAVGIILSILAFITVNSKRKRRDNNRERRTSQASGKICSFTYDEVVEITNSFERVIGKGGSCSVFYGRLSDGREVAVKVMTGKFSQGINEYTAEVELLMKVHHKCLVSFVGFCDEDQKMILVYEYMKKGDLQMLLSDETGTSDILDWGQRLQIAHSVAIGLEYLHSGCRPSIIHRDVKTSNILLNDKLEAKLADFGLSKIPITEEISHVSTVVAGTPGYIDPEYYDTNQLTEKSDVYSFGVVLFVLITGRHSVFIQEAQRLHIVKFVTAKIMDGDLASIIDPRLQGQCHINSVCRVAETAIACTSGRGITRPTMTEVVGELKAAMDAEIRRMESKRQPMELESRLLSTGPAETDMDSFYHPSAR
ncbi:probable LRR receptor-like serine/threonine-protein kinase At1g07560 [Nymphaea colorata]|nr:probable LRR receptor-like serine/threonine-protein kinase At1g07560 [Nymphaea colorata]